MQFSPIEKRCGLDVYPAETPLVFGSTEIYRAVRSGVPRILRRARMWGSCGSPSLQKALDIADAEFEKVANELGAKVAHHTWALREDRIGNDKRAHHLIPRGHVLVADVEAIKEPLPLLPDEREAIAREIDHYIAYGNRPVIWSDVAPKQFVMGRSHLDENSSLWMVDIEPCIDIRT